MNACSPARAKRHEIDLDAYISVPGRLALNSDCSDIDRLDE
jgi:hypothetical protein